MTPIEVVPARHGPSRVSQCGWTVQAGRDSGEALNDDKRLARIGHRVNQQTSAWNSTRCKYCSFQDPESRTDRQAAGSHEHSVLALIVL